MVASTFVSTSIVCVFAFCVQGHPPQHHRFDDPNIPAHAGIPNHITYAYKQDATIARNDDFYVWEEGGNKQIDLLFLIAGAPVSSISMPSSGSEPYVGAAVGMELAVEALAEKFPSFFNGQKSDGI